MSAEDVADGPPAARRSTTSRIAAVEQVRTVADDLTTRDRDLAPGRARCSTASRPSCIPHERADEDLLMPLVDRALGGPTPPRRCAAPTPRSSTRSAAAAACSTAARPPGGTSAPEDVIELRRLLYGLYAVCRLHNSQEEEGAFALVPATPSPGPPGLAVEPVHRGCDDEPAREPVDRGISLRTDPTERHTGACCPCGTHLDDDEGGST